MSNYSEIELGVPDCEWEAGDDMRNPATEQHGTRSSNDIFGRAKCLLAIRKILWLLLKSASLLSFSGRSMASDELDSLIETTHSNHVKLTESLLLPPSTADHGQWQREEYMRVFHTKIMSLESMQLPPKLVELYTKVHNPNTVAVIDRTVCQILQHGESARVLKSVMEANVGAVIHSSEGIWKQKLQQHQEIIALNMTQLVDTLSKTQDDTLVEMVDATAQSAAEMQSRQALIDLNKSMLSATQTAIPTKKPEPNSVEQQGPWSLSLSEQDIEERRGAIARQACSQLTA